MSIKELKYGFILVFLPALVFAFIISRVKGGGVFDPDNMRLSMIFYTICAAVVYVTSEVLKKKK